MIRAILTKPIVGDLGLLLLRVFTKNCEATLQEFAEKLVDGFCGQVEIHRFSAPGALPRLEAVITIGHPGQLNRARQGISLHLLSTPHGIALPLNDQNRGVHPLEMLNPTRVGLAQGMKGIPQANATTKLACTEELVSQEAGQAATHRFATNEKGSLSSLFIHFVTEVAEQSIGAIRGRFLARRPQTLHIGEFETNNTPATVS